MIPIFVLNGVDKSNFVIDTDNEIRMIEYVVNFCNLCHFIGLNIAAFAFTYAFIWGFTIGYNTGKKDGFTIDIDGINITINMNEYLMGCVLGFVATAVAYLIGFGWFIFCPIVIYGFYVGDIIYKTHAEETSSSGEFETEDEN